MVYDQRPHGCAISYGDEHHRIALVAVPAPADNGAGEKIRFGDDHDSVGLDLSVAPGLEHLVFTFESLGALLGTYARVKAAGVAPVYCMNHGPTISIYDADPDGHKNELQIDTMPMELANDRLLSPEFIANPVGWPFDPDELVASYEAGTPLIELMTVGREQYFRELVAANWLRTAIGRPGARLGDLAGVGSDWALRGLTFASLLESGVCSA